MSCRNRSERNESMSISEPENPMRTTVLRKSTNLSTPSLIWRRKFLLFERFDILNRTSLHPHCFSLLPLLLDC
ncbi:hypothetical protein JTE90_001873 [Oedothorax gibbosus]|uniref:Uncharacterized protein n=1 Tax=Oedothorax gibbosus TaxID=931172 RepID=A0AAV6VPQ6_9ARAC|nr:hypothetical protein JTE90_001873 [Oedothorax gibbosus]